MLTIIRGEEEEEIYEDDNEIINELNQIIAECQEELEAFKEEIESLTAANTELKEEVDVLTDQVVNHEEVWFKIGRTEMSKF